MSVHEFFVCYECNNWYLDKESCNKHMLNCLIEQDLSAHENGGFLKPKRRRKRKPSMKKKSVIASTICDICQVRFSKTQSLNLHKMRKHSDSRDFVCMTCGKGYKTKTDLSEHKSFHGEKISCSYCDFKSYPKNLKRHIQVIHLEQRNKVCEDCGKKFSDLGKLYKHNVAVHMKLKRFNCDSCEFVCGTVANLNAHRSKIHQSKVNMFLSDFKTSYKEIYNNEKPLI